MKYLHEETYSSTPRASSAWTMQRRPNYDFVLRAQGQTMGTMIITDLYDTESFRHKIMELVDVPLELIRGMKKQIEYDGHYIAFLLGQMDEDEFESISEEFVVEEKENIDKEKLGKKIRITTDLLDGDITVEELAQYFCCSEHDIISFQKGQVKKTTQLK